VQFHDRIAQLVYTFPEDSVTSTGAPFWSAPKRFPHPLSFDASDASQVLINVLLVLHQWGTGAVVSAANPACVENVAQVPLYLEFTSLPG
jgi:Ubiquitin-activating enzyme active site